MNRTESARLTGDEMKSLWMKEASYYLDTFAIPAYNQEVPMGPKPTLSADHQSTKY